VVYDDDDHRFMRQEKQGRYGEGVFVKRMSNPLQKTNNFARRLKSFLAEVDPRFRHVYIGAAAVFAPTADISAVHDPAGLIYASELPDFFLRQGRPDVSGLRSWLVDALLYVPTWDRIETKSGESMYGLFCQQTLAFTDASMRQLSIPFRDVIEARLAPGGFFRTRLTRPSSCAAASSCAPAWRTATSAWIASARSRSTSSGT